MARCKSSYRTRVSFIGFQFLAEVTRLHGMPDQASYDQALAIAQLILGRLQPAYIASTPQTPSNLYLHFPKPPFSFTGLSTPLPSSLTGVRRDMDLDEIISNGGSALDALEVAIEASNWALAAWYDPLQ